ncbi:hypothetical protein [Acinetobacter sp. 1207_04]|uniref:hypothetical protein n=1 Tax=Acinetobacter sp. 1207_04 TaxID=2604449 RepID=UPI00405A11C1
MIKRLIDFEYGSTEDLSDYLLIVAMNIEDSLMTAGAIPNKDYTYLDLIKLAQPFALDKMKSDESLNLLYPKRAG